MRVRQALTDEDTNTYRAVLKPRDDGERALYDMARTTFCSPVVFRSLETERAHVLLPTPAARNTPDVCLNLRGGGRRVDDACDLRDDSRVRRR